MLITLIIHFYLKSVILIDNIGKYTLSTLCQIGLKLLNSVENDEEEQETKKRRREENN